MSSQCPRRAKIVLMTTENFPIIATWGYEVWTLAVPDLQINRVQLSKSLSQRSRWSENRIRKELRIHVTFGRPRQENVFYIIVHYNTTAKTWDRNGDSLVSGKHERTRHMPKCLSVLLCGYLFCGSPYTKLYDFF
ncbi:hypothetical protein RRG08_051833 [Elysia crispata]|uniref:Uncharacterized protein n=1 Tax=Elysia crispata TaxID=231223 RepID=A0AAE1DC29_9GAST|nr:hypothetical protein RRG08_051833 [Elysia crispata]